MTTLERITSFASMMLSTAKIHQAIAKETDDTGRRYIGCRVYETFPNGSKRPATIKEVSWCPTCGENGNWLLYVEFEDSKTFVPGNWTTREALTLMESE